MARNKNSLKRYWPILLLAMLLAERAHAPSILGAHASTKTDDAAKPAAAKEQAPPDTKKNAKPDLAIPPGTDLPDPSTIEKTLKDLEPSAEDWLPWDIDLPADQPLSDPSSIDLLGGTNQLDNSPIADGLTGGTDGGGGDSLGPIPPLTEPTVDGDGGFDFTPGPNPAPAEPAHLGITVTQVPSVPEPGMMPVVMGMLALLGRRTKS